MIATLTNNEAQFEEAMTVYGLMPCEIVADGERHRLTAQKISEAENRHGIDYMTMVCRLYLLATGKPACQKSDATSQSKP